MTDYKEIDKEFDKEFLNEFGTPVWCCGGDFCFREDHIEEANDIKSFLHSKLKEAEERVVAEAKRRIYITCLANGNDKEGTYWITYGEVQELLDQLLIKSKDNV